MASQTQQLLNARKSGTVTAANARIKSQILKQVASKQNKGSPNDEDTDRIIKDYLSKATKESILTPEDVDGALDEIEGKPGLEFYVAADKQGFKSELYNKTLGEKIKKINASTVQIPVTARVFSKKRELDAIQKSRVTLRSGKVIPGIKISPSTYLVVYHGQISARSFKTGYFVPIPKGNKVIQQLERNATSKIQTLKTVAGLKISENTYLEVTPENHIIAKKINTGTEIPVPLNNKIVKSL